MIYSIVICIIFFAALIIWLGKFLSEAGVTYPNSALTSFITKKYNTLRPDGSIERYECLKVFLIALIFRIAVFLLTWIAKGIFSEGGVIHFLDYCRSWSVWDGPHYIEIAQYGYAHKIEEGNFYMVVFFPLYPLIIKMFAAIFRNYVVSALIVSTLAYCAGCVAAYKLITIDYSRSVARTSLVLLSIAPFAFFYGSVMTESLFFLLIILTFYAIRKHNWLLTGIFGMLSALTRSFGVLMLIPAAVEWVQSEQPVILIKNKEWHKLGKRFLHLLPILIMPIGTLIYLFINYKTTGDPFIFVKYQSEHWSMNLQFFGKTAHMIWDSTLSSNYSWTHITSMFLPELIALPILALLILYSIRRTRSAYSVFMLIYFAFNAAASWPLSLSRYLACMFPVYWVIAEFTDRHKWLELPLVAVSAVAFGIYLTGYITVHNIM